MRRSPFGPSATARFALSVLALSCIPALADIPAGTVQSYFSQPGATATAIRAAALDSQGRVVAASSTTSKGAFRLNLDGTKDSGFASNTFNNTLTSLLQQSDGRILIGGLFTLVNGVTRPYLVRLDANGVVDPTFPQTAIGGTGVQVMVPGSGGKFYLGKVNGYGIQRYTSEGARDDSFLSPTLGFGQINGVVTAVRELASGQVLVADVTSDNTSFGTINGYHLKRVSSTGEIDPSFTPPAIDRRITGLDILPDNRIAIIGEFTTVNGSAHGGVAILGENGALDGSFNTTLTNTASASAPRFGVKFLDDRLFIYGDFTQVNGQDLRGLARLKLDGSIDSDFVIGTGASDRVDTLIAAPSGDLFVGGNFWVINSVTHYYGAYLTRTNTVTPPADPFTDFLVAAGVPSNQRGPLDDADHDGISNLLEFALGLRPALPDANPLALATTGGNLSLSYHRARQDLTYSVETSTDLSDPNSWTIAGVDQGIPAPDGTTVASVAIDLPHRFLRLKVTQ